MASTTLRRLTAACRRGTDVQSLKSEQGQTLVEFRSIDNTNLTSAWTRVAMRIDRTDPSDPIVAGGSTMRGGFNGWVGGT